MNIREVRRLKSRHEKKLKLYCDEYHAHSVDCLSGPKDSVAIVSLAFELLSLKSRIKKFAKKESK